MDREAIEFGASRNISEMLGTRFAGCRLENYQEYDPRQTKAKEKIIDWVEHGAHRFLFLSGVPGSGKDHMVAGAIAEWLQRNPSGTLTTVSFDELHDLKLSAQSQFKSWTEQIDGVCFRPRLLIITELGMKAGTESTRQVIERVIDNGYKNERPMIFTTNLDFPKLGEWLDSPGIDRAMRRVMDMTEGGRFFIACNWVPWHKRPK